VYLLRRGKTAVSLALLTERVLCYVAVADAFPRVTVPFPGGRVASVLLIFPRVLFGVGLAEPAGGQVGATGVGAGFLRFIWRDNLLQGKAKALMGFPP